MEIQHPYLDLTRDDQKASLEAVLFTSGEVVSLKMLYELLIKIEDKPVYKFGGNGSNGNDSNGNGSNGNGHSENDSLKQELNDLLFEKYGYNESYFVDMIDEINRELIATNRPFQIVSIAGGYQYATRPEYGELITKLMKSKTRRRLSQAALETLAIIAYRQPVSKPEIEQIRGVNSNEIVNSLLDKGLIKIAGRSEALGKPLVYATSDEFLKVFGLNSLKDLPKLKELEEFTDINDDSDRHIELVIDATQDTPLSNFRQIQEKIEEGIEVKSNIRIEE